MSIPITRLADSSLRRRVEAILSGRHGDIRVFAFASTPPYLGGEVDIPETEWSPGSKVDVSIFELLQPNDTGAPALGDSAIFEIQTADFHGSPLHAVRHLRSMGPPSMASHYHALIASNPEMLGEKLEGPNKANIFKRTIYQLLVKFEVANSNGCAGACIVLPTPVWESWARHLGRPALVEDIRQPGVLTLCPEGDEPPAHFADQTAKPAWIFVFEIDRDSPESPRHCAS